jgi:hypothetical protein
MTPERLRQIEDHAMRADLVPSELVLELLAGFRADLEEMRNSAAEFLAFVERDVRTLEAQKQAMQPLFSALKAWHLADQLAYATDEGWADADAATRETLKAYREYKRGGS